MREAGRAPAVQAKPAEVCSRGWSRVNSAKPDSDFNIRVVCLAVFRDTYTILLRGPYF